MMMDEGLDTGDMLLRRELPIGPEEDAHHDRPSIHLAVMFSIRSAHARQKVEAVLFGIAFFEQAHVSRRILLKKAGRSSRKSAAASKNESL